MKTIAALILALTALPAHALYKCEVNGRIEYQETPCAQGKPKPVYIDPMTPTGEDTAYARRRAEMDMARQGIRREADVDGQLRGAARMETRSARRSSVRCDQLRRSAQMATNKSAAKPEDEYLANRAIDLRQNYEVECR